MTFNPKAAGAALAFIVSGCAAFGSGGDTGVLHTIPFEMEGGRMLVTASIDGADEARFLLDTGGSDGLFTRAFVESAGLTIGEQSELSSPVGGRVTMVDTAVYNTVSFDGFEVPGSTALVLENDQFPLPGVDGVISLIPFAAHIVEFDLGGEELRVVDTPTKPVASWQAHPAENTFLTLDVTVGEVAIPAHIDSGNPGMTTLPLAYAEQLPLADELVEIGRMRTVDAERVLYSAALTEPLLIAGLAAPPGPVVFADIPFANVGSAVLSNWVLVVDGPGRRFGFYERD